jgi:hypothetical protein
MPYFMTLILVLAVLGILIWMKESKNQWAVLGIAFVVGISIFGLFFWQSRQSSTSLRVVGYASKLFESDLVKWNVTFQKTLALPSSAAATKL